MRRNMRNGITERAADENGLEFRFSGRQIGLKYVYKLRNKGKQKERGRERVGGMGGVILEKEGLDVITVAYDY